MARVHYDEDAGFRERRCSLSLRDVLVQDSAHRDAIASDLLCYRDGHGDELGRHHRHADDASGGATERGAAARRDRGRHSRLR